MPLIFNLSVPSILLTCLDSQFQLFPSMKSVSVESHVNSAVSMCCSLRCQSLLSLKIYQMRRFEHKDNQRQLNRYFQVRHQSLPSVSNISLPSSSCDSGI